MHPWRTLFSRSRTWLFIGGVLVLTIAFALLSDWQWHRHEQRDSSNARIRAALAADPVPLTSLLDGTNATVPVDVEWRLATATGHYDASHQVLIRYRHVDDTSGFEVVTPLDTPAGVLWVDRGWIPPSDDSKDDPTPPPPPSGEVTVTGHVRLSEGVLGTPDPASGSVRSIAIPTLTSWLGADAYPVYLSATDEAPAPPAAPKRLPVVELSGGPHVSYAIQWGLFAAIAITGLVKFLGDDLKMIKNESR